MAHGEMNIKKNYKIAVSLSHAEGWSDRDSNPVSVSLQLCNCLPSIIPTWPSVLHMIWELTWVLFHVSLCGDTWWENRLSCDIVPAGCKVRIWSWREDYVWCISSFMTMTALVQKLWTFLYITLKLPTPCVLLILSDAFSIETSMRCFHVIETVHLELWEVLNFWMRTLNMTAVCPFETMVRMYWTRTLNSDHSNWAPYLKR